MGSASKIIVWALFDSETGDWTRHAKKHFGDLIDVYGVGLSHYGKDTDHYLNFNLADFSSLFDNKSIAKKLLDKLPKPDIIVASPPCESWSQMTSINNGNIHWKRYASKLFPENKIFQLQDISVRSGFVRDININTFYTRINGELCHQNTWDIIKEIKPAVFIVENPENYCWDYINAYIDDLPKMHLNKTVYSAYDPYNFSAKREIFASNIKFELKKYTINKTVNSVKSGADKNGKISKNYSTRSQIPELLVKDLFEQSIERIQNVRKSQP